MPGRPRLTIGKGRAATIRKWLGKSDKDIGDEAKRLGITRIQQYESLNSVYKQLKENRKWQTKNKNKKGKPINEPNFLQSIVDAPEPVREAANRIGLDKVKKYFVNVKYYIDVYYKQRDGNYRPFREQIDVVQTATTTRGELHNIIAERIRNEVNIEDSHFYRRLVPNSITYTIQRAEDLTRNARNIENIGMNRCGVLRYDFMPKIAEISFKTTEMMCVVQCLADLYANCRRPLSKKEIETDLQAIYMRENEMEEIPQGHVFSFTPKMISEWAKQKDITCYAFDQKNKLFHKRVSKNWNRPPLVYYSVDEHMYMIQDKKTIESIVKKHAVTTKSLTSFVESEKDTVDLSHLPIYDYEDLIDIVDRLPIYTFSDACEWIQAPSIVMVQSANLYDIFIGLFRSGKVPLTKFKGDDKIKVIPYVRKDGLVVQVMADASYGSYYFKGEKMLPITYKNVMKLCKDLDIPFTNQGMGTLSRNYLNTFRKRQKVRANWSCEERKQIKLKKGSKCCKCDSCLSLQIDHIVPIAKGGSNEIDNLQLLCRACHLQKTTQEAANGDYLQIDDIISSFNTKVKNIFDSHEMKKWAFVEKLGDYEAKYGFDINKCRKNIAYFTKYEWCVYSVMDDVKPFCGQVRAGFFYVNSCNTFPLRGNGWYSQAMVEYCLHKGIISHEDIIYELVPSLTLKPDYFREFIDNVYANFGDLSKLAINALIGCFYRQDFKFISKFYTRSFDETCYLFTEYQGSHAFYKKELDAYEVSFSETRTTNETEAPLYLQILDEEAVELHKLYEIVENSRNTRYRKLNYDEKRSIIIQFIKRVRERKMELSEVDKCLDETEKAEIIREYNGALNSKVKIVERPNVSWVKTDCVYSDKWCDISTYEWAPGVPKYKYEKVKVTGIEMMPRVRRSNVFKLRNSKWNIMADNGFTKNDGCCLRQQLAEQVIELKSCNIDGAPGVGKSLLIWELKKVFDHKKIRYVCLAPTNKAARNIGGTTIDKYLGKGKRLSKMKKLASSIDAIIIDEISMMHEQKYKVLLALKKLKPELRFILVGDFKQLLPVKDRAVFDYENSQALFDLCAGNRVELTHCRRSNKELFELYMNVQNVDKDEFGKKITMRNICFTNECRKKINEYWMNKSVKGRYYVDVAKYELDPESQDMKLTIGTPVIARRNCREMDICNNDTYKIAQVSNKQIELDNGLVIDTNIFSKYFRVAYCVTTHSSQGETIKEEYTIWEWDRMDERLRYVALSRGECKENIHII